MAICTLLFGLPSAVCQTTPTVPRAVLAPFIASNGAALHPSWQPSGLPDNKAPRSAFEAITLNGEAGARDAGKLRLEGKEYAVKDGDVFHFRFNV